jgi:hypothetical protein
MGITWSRQFPAHDAAQEWEHFVGDGPQRTQTINQ